MRLLLVIAMMASMLFAATAAYALGGGGHHGDGRRDFSRPANAVPQAVNGQDNNPGNPNDLPVPTASIPEPITALLLGIGICLTTGFIVRKRKQKS
ncbi:MAG: PEP-CTERM sorting domain-containing protein [Syntrophorhabdales bacterium]|jgi:hypothetical protein